MKANKSTILLVLDRSGSMQTMHGDLVGGVNTFIEGQKQLPGECSVSVVQFDDKVEEVLWNNQIAFVPTFTTKEHFVPDGGTALFDAITYGVDKLGAELAATPEEERPSKVIVVIYTDGFENASKKSNRATVKELITHQRDKYAWEFIFMGSNQDAVLTAETMGISRDAALTFNNSAVGNSAAYQGLNYYASGCRIEGTGVFTAAIRSLAVSQ